MAIRKRAKPYDPARHTVDNEPGKSDARQAGSISPAQSTRRPRSAFKAYSGRVITRSIADVIAEYGNGVQVEPTRGMRRIRTVVYYRAPETLSRPVSESMPTPVQITKLGKGKRSE